MISLNENTKIKITGIIGVFAALLMYSGDMLLYFTDGAYDTSAGLTEYVRIMSELNPMRLLLGGILGPVSAFFYYIGFMQVHDAIKPPKRFKANVFTCLIGFYLFIGGTYHFAFCYLGLVGKSGDEEAISAVVQSIEIMQLIASTFLFSAFIYLIVLILMKKTAYPRWFVLLTPAVLMWLPFDLLPQPLRMIVAGGASNLVFIPFFIVSTYILSNRKSDLDYS